MGRFAERLSKGRPTRRVEGTWPGEDWRGDEAVSLPCAAIKTVTEAAALLLIEGEEFWIPLGQLDYADVDEDLARMSPWIADQKGLT
jgi:hypothetical protein